MSSDIRLAIVGSVRFVEPLALYWADSIIDETICRLDPAVVISGGADGIDTRVREVAEQLGYTPENGRLIEHLPAHLRWEPDGYKARNLQIVADCTDLLCIRCHVSTTYGSGWTADQADRLGKTVRRVLL